ncbi:unnamed protein product [Ilex paraguariensis]|uniref:Uncharacterized protein n=1 Tax=Ilex paraguariensis TaxID=185542 RepID=A0ABC8TYD6_9AQUA
MRLSPLFVSCAPQKPQIGAGAQSSQSSQVETVSLGNEELNESGSTSSGATDFNNISNGVEKGASKWQLKRKRNSRHTSKSKKQVLRKDMDVDEESDLTGMEPRDVFSLGSGRKDDCNPIGGSVSSDSCTYRPHSRPVPGTQIDEFQGWGTQFSHKEARMRVPTAEVLTPQRSLPYRQSRFTVNPRYEISDFPLRNCNADSPLYDVNLEVKASYRPQHVPYISLMSKLNGQPITGHPLTIEVLEDGYCDLMLSVSECYSSISELDDGVGENTLALQGVDMANVRRPNSDGRIPTKHIALQSHVSPRKSPKSRKNGFLSKKIRKLSSLTGSHKLCVGEKKPVVEKLKGPAVACVPIKVVFSRINATLSSTMRPAHRVMTPSKV